MSANNDDRQLVESYLNLRRGVGLLGVALPVILPFGVLFLGSSRVLQESISDYHGTVMKGVFVGALFATAGHYIQEGAPEQIVDAIANTYGPTAADCSLHITTVS